jgi:fused signal recognition particle receptor
MFRFFRKKSPAPAAPEPEPSSGSAADDELAFAQADAAQARLAAEQRASAGMASTFESTPALAPLSPAAEAPCVAGEVGEPPSAPTGATVDPAGVLDARAASAATRTGWFARLRDGLRKTGANLSQVFGDARIDDSLYEDLETALLMADTGVGATEAVLEELKARVQQTRATDRASVRELLVDILTRQLKPLEGHLDVGLHAPTVIMVAGVNGAGKTTSIGKLTRHLADAGCKVLLAAADTFRAAAKEQLAVWADRNRVQIVAQQGGDPAAVAFDAVAAGQARASDVVVVDTAGRLATQAHLMEELRKIRRTIGKALPGAPHEVLLVVDGNTGQNALAQAKAFDDAIEITGLIVTKLDGTAKGGVLAAIARWAAERQRTRPDARPVAVYFVGVGEALEDLERFDAKEFAQALLGR